MKSWRPVFRPRLETVEDRLPPGSLLGGDATGHDHDELLGVVGLMSGMNVMGANFNVLPPNANTSYPNGPGATHPFGQTYGQWAADWWTWEFTKPADLTSQIGAASGPGNSGGNVWFPDAVFSSSGAVTRDFTVPAGTAIFMPIVNASYIQFPTDDPQLTIDQMRAISKDAVDSMTNVSASIDGVAVSNIAAQRVQSPVFQFTNVPADSLGAADGVTPGSVGVDDGYYLMLSPLSVGTHTIHVTGASAELGFSADVTVNITVTPRSH